MKDGPHTRYGFDNMMPSSSKKEKTLLKRSDALILLKLAAFSVRDLLMPIVIVGTVGGSVLAFLLGIAALWIWSPVACVSFLVVLILSIKIAVDLSDPMFMPDVRHRSIEKEEKSDDSDE